MKINKMITIDQEINDKLRETDNASGLINRLLREFFEINQEKKKSLLENRENYLKSYLKKAKEVKNEVKILRKVEDLGIDFKSVRWLRNHLDVPSLYEIAEYRRNRKITANSDAFVTAYSLIQKHGALFEKI